MKLTKHFIDDAITAAVSLITIVLTWLVGLGWSTDKIIPVHDGISMGYVLYKDYVERGGVLLDSLYSASWKGGSKLFEVANFPFDLQFLSWLKLSPQTITNLHTFFIQFLCASLSLIIARNILIYISEKDFNFPIPQKIFAVILTGFTPMIAWRLGMGHDIIVMGALAFLGGVGILTCNLSHSWTEISVLLIIATFAFIFQSVGQQTLTYSIVFGLPFFIAIILMDIKKTLTKKSALLFIGLVLFTSLGISITKFWPFFQNAVGTDSSRGLSDQVLTYSYITATFEDWFCSLFWSKSWIPLSRTEGFHHEVHYGLGPLLIFIFLFPFKKTKKLHIAMATSIAMVMFFSMNISPVSDLFLTLFPFLKSFRVPERSIFSVGLMLPILSLIAMSYRIHFEDVLIKYWHWLVGFGVGVFLLMFPDDVREYFYWGLSFALLFSLYLSKNIFNKIIIYSLPIFAIGSMSYFKEKLHPYQSESEFDSQVVGIGRFLKSNIPALNNPLNRVVLEGQAPLFMVNTAKAAGVSSLDGYWFQPSRFIYTVAALQNRESNSTESFHGFDVRSPDFPFLQQLYNIQALVRFENGSPKIEALPSTIGPAWFSSELKEVNSFSEFTNQLKQSPLIGSTLKDKTFVVKTDPVFKERAFPKAEGSCAGSTVKNITPVNYDQDFQLEVQSTGTCPVVVATTFVSNFKAVVTDGPMKDSELEVFPANGSLIGIMVPNQVNKFVLKAVLKVPIWSKIFYFLSFITFIGIFIYLRKTSEFVPEGKSVPVNQKGSKRKSKSKP